MATNNLNSISSSFQTMLSQNLDTSFSNNSIQTKASENNDNIYPEDDMSLMDKIALEMQRGV